MNWTPLKGVKGGKDKPLRLVPRPTNPDLSIWIKRKEDRLGTPFLMSGRVVVYPLEGYNLTFYISSHKDSKPSSSFSKTNLSQ